MKKTTNDLVCSSLLLSAACLYIFLIARSFLDVVHGGEKSGHHRVYTFAVQLLCPSISLVSAALSLITSFYYVKRYIVLSSLLFGIMSVFGSLMICAITFFDATWSADHLLALKQCLQLFLNLVIFIVSIYETVVATRLFHFLDTFPRQHPSRPLPEAVSRAVSVLASLLIISGGAAILGFAMGTTTLSGRPPGGVLYWGGIHSGCLGIFCGVMAVICVYFCQNYRFQGVLITSLVVCLLLLVSSALSFYTEELELQRHMRVYPPPTTRTNAVRNILLAKSALVIFSALLNLLLTPALLCCLVCNLHDSFSDRMASAHHPESGPPDFVARAELRESCPGLGYQFVQEDYDPDKHQTSPYLSQHHARHYTSPSAAAMMDTYHNTNF